MKIKMSEKHILTIELHVSPVELFAAHGKAMDIAQRYDVLESTTYAVHVSGYGRDSRTSGITEMQYLTEIASKYPEERNRVIQYEFPPLEYAEFTAMKEEIEKAYGEI